MGDNLPALALGSASPIKSITVGGSQAYTVEHGRACAIFENGTVKCWGESIPLTPAQLAPLDFGLNDSPASP